jgi:hypothetical protein
MKNSKLICIGFMLMFVFTGMPAQINKAKVNFEEEVYDFGTINIDGGYVSHDFSFVNIGSTPFIINNVRTSCGCTSPEWTREPVIPGQSGSVTVRFNPRGRPGPFSKSITINSNAEMQPIVLRIKGTVETAAPEVTKEQKLARIIKEYKYGMGDLRLKNTHVAFGEILKGTSETKTVRIANSSAENSIKPSIKSIPEFLTIAFKPAVLEPAGEGEIEITYNSKLIDEWDRAIHRLYIKINDLAPRNNMLTVTATITEDFSGLTEDEKANAPGASFDSRTFNFGTIKQGKKVEHNFILKNTGNSDLLIRRVWATCGCTAVAPRKMVIKPGDDTQIRAVFDSSGRKGNQKKMITVITNDPVNPKILLWLEGIVEI